MTFSTVMKSRGSTSPTEDPFSSVAIESSLVSVVEEGGVAVVEVVAFPLYLGLGSRFSGG